MFYGVNYNSGILFSVYMCVCMHILMYIYIYIGVYVHAYAYVLFAYMHK